MVFVVGMEEWNVLQVKTAAATAVFFLIPQRNR